MKKNMTLLLSLALLTAPLAASDQASKKNELMKLAGVAAAGAVGGVVVYKAFEYCFSTPAAGLSDADRKADAERAARAVAAQGQFVTQADLKHMSNAAHQAMEARLTALDQRIAKLPATGVDKQALAGLEKELKELRAKQQAQEQAQTTFATKNDISQVSGGVTALTKAVTALEHAAPGTSQALSALNTKMAAVELAAESAETAATDVGNRITSLAASAKGSREQTERDLKAQAAKVEALEKELGVVSNLTNKTAGALGSIETAAVKGATQSTAHVSMLDALDKRVAALEAKP